MTIERLHKAIKSHSEMDDEQIREAGEHGADAGWPGFSYTGDCVDFYNANRDAICELLTDDAEEFGHASVAEFVGTFGRAEMTDTPDGYANLLAWYALEKVGRWLEDAAA
jgi:hypothetical protein